MRWSILILMSLSLACSKKEPAAPAEPEQAAEAESAPLPHGSELMTGQVSDPTAEVPIPKGAAELPEPLKTAAPALTAPPVLQVLEQGQEPRQALRWNIKPGFEQKLSANVGYLIDAIVVVMRVGEPIYVVSYDLTMRAEKVEDDGSVRVSFAVDNANIDMKTLGEKRVSRMKLALTSARKLTGSYTLGPRGRVTAFEMKVPSDATRTAHDMADNLRWALLHMTPTFPDEPLGQGAKWTVHEGIRQGGVHVNQLTTLQLVKLEGSRVELAVEQQQSAAKQSFQDPGLAMTKKLTLLSGMANGPLTWDLAELAPRAADLGAGILKAVEQPRTDDPTQRPVEVIIKAHRALQITAE
jgi:hypothetical protein